MNSKRVVLYYDDECDPKISEFLARVPQRRTSSELRRLLLRGMEEEKKGKRGSLVNNSKGRSSRALRFFFYVLYNVYYRVCDLNQS